MGGHCVESMVIRSTVTGASVESTVKGALWESMNKLENSSGITVLESHCQEHYSGSIGRKPWAEILCWGAPGGAQGYWHSAVLSFGALVLCSEDTQSQCEGCLDCDG